MPLPDGGDISWPPEHCVPVNQQYATWSAWYSGDPERLVNTYAGGGSTRDATGFFASERGGFRAGVRRALDTVRRWFWGNRNAASTPRQRLHVPIAGDIAAASADLLFSEPPAVTVPHSATQARLAELLDDGAHATLLEAAEVCAALGGVYVRIVWDPSARPGRPWITAVHPDVAVPEWRWGRLSAVTFWREISRRGRTVVRHLERHEPGLILHGVYEGDAETLGRVVPLTDYPDTARLAAGLVNGNEIRTGAPGLTAVYVPNMKPNRIWRTVPEAANLGRSDYAGVEALMDALDLTYSSWMRDVELGKARLIVPREYLRSNGPGQGASVDLDQEVYEGINVMGSDAGGVELKEVQFDIRVEQHQATITDLKTSIVTAAGYSAQTFGLVTDGTAITATEVAAKTRRSLITRDRKTRYWRPALGDLYETLLWVDRVLFGSPVVPQRPAIEWPDAVSVDPLAQAQTLQALATAEAISTWQKVKTLHPDWEDTAVQKEVDRIHAGLGTGDPIETSLSGLAGNNPPPSDEGEPPTGEA